MSILSDLYFETSLIARTLAGHVTGAPLRLGVTGLSRAGKTVFLTALIQQLTRGGRLPVFRVQSEGRLISAGLQPQPDDHVPRFAYEDHLASLNAGAERAWPQSTRRISQIRLHLEFERKGGWFGGPSSLDIDVIDYPGEWLLDLALLTRTYAQWSHEMLAPHAGQSSGQSARSPLADWLGYTMMLDPLGPASEETARTAADLFTTSQRVARQDRYGFSSLAPGRFLLPGDMEGSPALTFAPLNVAEGTDFPAGSLTSMMQRRYEAYKTHVVRPFFQDHFARLDRQIVLVDVLSALNAGPSALRDLEQALGGVLAAFRTGQNGLVSSLFRPKIDRILFAATRADHLHHTSHDALEAMLRLLTARALARAQSLGARVDVIALAAVRATHEAKVKSDGARQMLDAIVGIPEAGEAVGPAQFDGFTEAAVFPGSLPADPRDFFESDGAGGPRADFPHVHFPRFRPPLAKIGPDTRPRPLPHIRLDRALEFLLGDRLS